MIWQIFLLTVSNGLFIESDSYTHALRLTDFIRSGSWKEVLYAHDNCPFGQNLHFTRITDLVLFLTTLPFLPFTELNRAVLFGGFLYNPVIACLSAAALVWAGKAFCSPLVRMTGVLAYFFFLPEITDLFLAGRPDHHVLLNLFLILLSGCLLYGAKTQKSVYYKAAGVFGGLAVWTSPEGFLACLFLYAGMTAAWLLRCQNIRQIRIFSLFLFIATAVFWLMNPPLQGLFYPDNSRLSVFTVVVFGFAFLSFYALEILKKESLIPSFGKRLLSLSVLAFFSFGFALFPFGPEAFLASPIPPEIFNIWASGITELLPTAYPVLACFGVILLFAAAAFFAADVRFRKVLLTNGLPFLLFTLAAYVSVRFCRLAAVYAVFVILFTLRIMRGRFSFLNGRPVVFLWIGAMAAFLVPAVYSSYDRQLSFQSDQNDFKSVVPYLSERDGCVLTLNDLGPETAWGTGKAVIGSPYHSNVDGIVDSYNIFNDTDMNNVRALLKKRAVTTLILPNPTEYEEIITLSKQQKLVFKSAASTLPTKLVFEKKSFCFLKPVTNIPGTIGKKYFVWHVDFGQCEDGRKDTFSPFK